ncbi:flagellar protein FlaG [Pelagibius sp. Alg239-R121]|uniref:flagellar protein FlaG n=1 Tax=Pelagibius sp. Alg239-R121 TaxID=2993448 RepID=UPI0024A7360A|nr:flagellar protein FlaG [Pelagibius sp. Alg239-R121]
MVDASFNPTGQKNPAPASKAPAATSKINAAPAAGIAPAPVENASASAAASSVSVAAKQPATQQAAPIVSKVSGLATYRDHESGRLVVQIFDQKRGDVILEFPTENMLRAYPTSSPLTAIDHVIETKA